MRHVLLFVLCLQLGAFAADFRILRAKNDAAAEAGLVAAVPEWPTRQQPLAQGETVSAPWERMTQAQVDALKAAHASAKQTYEQSKPDDPQTAQRKQDVQTLRTFMGTTNGTITNAQRDAVIKALIRVVASEARD